MMERRSWAWKRKSCEMNSEESDNSESPSERGSGDHEVILNGDSPTDTSQNHAQLQDVSSNIRENEEVNETVKSLTEKLSAALLSINAKEELVKQHSKVAEEAVSGWENAETEVAILKQQLDTTTQKNSTLNDRVSHLDGALKECVRQLRQSKDEHEQKLNDAITKITQKLESNNFELEKQLIDLNSQLEASQIIEKENTALKKKLLFQSEELKILKEESEFSTQAAETASKQHLESIKKVAKLEAECRKLKALIRKTSSTINDHKDISISGCVDSTTDSQSDNCSDSWASALIAELDQFKNEKVGPKIINGPLDIDLMDDFLEMERLAAIVPEAETEISNSSKVEAEIVMKQKIAELEEKVEILESEKAKLEVTLSESQYQLSIANELKQAAIIEIAKLKDEVALLEGSVSKSVVLSSELKSKLKESEKIKEEIESQLHLASVELVKLKQKVALLEDIEITNLQEKVRMLEQRIEDERTLCKEFEDKLEIMEGEKMRLEFELELKQSEIKKLSDRIILLEEDVDEERVISSRFALRCQNLEDEIAKRREAEPRMVSSTNGELTGKQEKELAVAAEKLAECQKTIASLGQQLKSLTTLDDIILESEKVELNGDYRSTNTKTFTPSDSTPTNGKGRGSPLSGLGKLLSRSRSSTLVEN